jgi:hypothetical protein
VGQNYVGNWACALGPRHLRRMAIVALAVMVGVVLFDAHEFINRRSRRH